MKSAITQYNYLWKIYEFSRLFNGITTYVFWYFFFTICCG